MDGRKRVLLAGLAAARHGTMEALAAVAARPHVTLLVRPGEGMEPADLLAHPQVAVADDAQRRHLRGVDLVLAPAWCETYLAEVTTAAAVGVPVVATQRAAGWLTPVPDSASESALGLAPGDSQALGVAMDRALAAPGPPDLSPRVHDAHDRLVATLRAVLAGS